MNAINEHLKNNKLKIENEYDSWENDKLPFVAQQYMNTYIWGVTADRDISNLMSYWWFDLLIYAAKNPQ